MFRTNTPADVANTGRVKIDAGEGVAFEVPTVPAAGATWATLPGKPSTFPPSTHSHTQAQVSGLVDALAGKVGTADPRLAGTWDNPIDLGTAHLDTITTPGFYTQIFAARATKAQGYPHDSAAGVLEVKMWNKTSGNVIAIYTPWQSNAMTKRTRYNGTWQTWYGVNGSAIA